MGRDLPTWGGRGHVMGRDLSAWGGRGYEMGDRESRGRHRRRESAQTEVYVSRGRGHVMRPRGGVTWCGHGGRVGSPARREACQDR
eukprot:6401021-Prymnesium_polylepis.1